MRHSLNSVDKLVTNLSHFVFCHLIQVYYSEELVTVPVAMIEGKCEVRLKDDVSNSDLPVVVEHVFYCEHLFDPVTGALKQVRLLNFTLFYF